MENVRFICLFLLVQGLLVWIAFASAGEGSAVELGDIDSGGSAEEQAVLTLDTGALPVLRSSQSAAHEMESATGTWSGTSSLRN